MSLSIEGYLRSIIQDEYRFNINVLQKGDVIAVQSMNKATEWAQKITTISSRFGRSCHVAVVADVNERAITLIESLHSSDLEWNGVNVNTYTSGEYYNQYGGQAIHVLRNPSLQPYMIEVIDQFVQSYPPGHSTTQYTKTHLLGAFFLFKNDTKKGRLRTLHSRLEGKFMTAKGTPRKSITCPAVVADIVKIAQINQAIVDKPEEEAILSDLSQSDQAEEKLRALQEEHLVLNVTSKRVIPGRLEEELVTNHGFQLEVAAAVVPLGDREEVVNHHSSERGQAEKNLRSAVREIFQIFEEKAYSF